ncbi:MAG: hypothetical protein K2H40_14165 [Lachnospiraceae bacterium]|nr:hypothetical protein [Lachnospiraceae bacterium]
MREKDIMDKMRSEVVIPVVVQERAELAFEKIRKREGQKVVKMRSKKTRRKTMWVVVAAAVFALGTMTVCAAYLHWSKGLEAEFNATDEQKQLLEEGQYTAPLNSEDNENNGSSNNGDNGRESSNSVTVEGVTITPQQSIVDSRFAWLSFKVEGYDLEEGKEPCFQYITVEVEGDKDAIISYGSHFYDGIRRGTDGKLVYEDGSPAEEEIFVNEDGSMEYIIMVDATQYGENGLIGKNVHVEFTDLGTVYKAEYFPNLEAVWAFDFTLKGSDKVRTLNLSEPLGDSGATVIYAEISPISIYVNYDFPLQKEAIEGLNENGEPITSTTFVEAPPVAGVRLKDGTLLLYIMNGGVEGYLDESHEVYTVSYALDRILDADQVDALLFQKGWPEGEGSPTEDDLYIVPIQ